MMENNNLLNKLKPILTKKIEEAINIVDCESFEDESFPWFGDECFKIMADSVICVIHGMQDSQDFMEKEDMLKLENLYGT